MVAYTCCTLGLHSGEVRNGYITPAVPGGLAKRGGGGGSIDALFGMPKKTLGVFVGPDSPPPSKKSKILQETFLPLP